MPIFSDLGAAGLLLLFGFALHGCVETANDVLEAHSAGAGTAEVYALGADQAWEAAKAVFRWNKSELIEDHRKEHYMLSNIPVLEGAGAICGAWVESIDAQNTKVTVITKRREPTNPVTPLTERGFHEDFKRAAELLKSGRTLPSARP